MYRGGRSEGLAGPSLVSAWSGHRLGNAAVGADARTAETIAGEPGKAAVVLRDFDQIVRPTPRAAVVAERRGFGGPAGSDEVAAMLVRGEPPALAAVALGAGADADLVHPVRLGAGGDDVAAGALVGVEDLVGVELVEAEAAEDVSGGGWVLHLR